MTRESTYGPEYTRLVKAASGNGGVSAAELAERVGSSRQQAYQWVMRNGRNLRALGMSPSGAQRYAWRDPGAPVSSDEVEVGNAFTVTRIRYAGGRILAVLEADNGVRLEAELGADGADTGREVEAPKAATQRRSTKGK